MKAATLTNKTNMMSVPMDQQQQQQEQQQQAVMDETYVTQSRHTSFSSTGDDYSTETVPTADINSLMDQNIWSLQQNMSNQHVVHPLDSALMMNNWDPNVFDLKSQGWSDLTLSHPEAPLTETPPVYNTGYANNQMLQLGDFGFNQNIFPAIHHSAPPTALSTPNNSGLITPPMTNYFHQRSSLPSTHSKKMMYMNNSVLDMNRRNSSDDTRRYGKRASSHPSVASVVSLTAHEPVSKIIDGIEYITFLYSHDRLVKEYTVRTDVDHVNMDDIVMDFRIQNAIYPRANVDRSEYDGNRWDYETTCNQLGWKLCWLNKDQLFGRRGLIQRAVDSYRNRHAEMRSRRVTRQEKVANGTLRKRRSKKSLIHNTL